MCNSYCKDFLKYKKNSKLNSKIKRYTLVGLVLIVYNIICTDGTFVSDDTTGDS